MLKPFYDKSYALVIGINEYAFISPLGYAVSDAKGVADILIDKYHFPKENVCILLDKDATKQSILQNYLSFASQGSALNDRLLIFFAGHGHTLQSHRGDVGFLVPCDGDQKDLSTLIRWDEITRYADLIEAKHILFIMDACYGGLAITRALTPGSLRFLKDMLLRTSRQVLTAGKANEVVADYGGPLPAHSVFTGHLLEGLSGKASSADGLITANGLMTYVYHQVSRDSYSQQTPHFGYLHGDGDFIFDSPQAIQQEEEPTEDKDILVSVPSVYQEEGGINPMTIVDEAKEFLSEEKHKIRLHELVAKQVRQAISSTADDHFPIQARWSEEEFTERLKRYETATKDLCSIEALLGYWGMETHRDILTIPIKRMTCHIKKESGLTAWLNLRWYPAFNLLYAGGLAAVAANKYDNLCSLLHAEVSDPERVDRHITIISNMMESIVHIEDAFKSLPGLANCRTARNEYLFKFYQPLFDDLFLLGAEYEPIFDRFEVILALEVAEQYNREFQGAIWGPIGRFVKKARWGSVISPLQRIISEAESQGNAWPPIVAVLFNGSIERFKEIAVIFNKDILTTSRYM